MNKKNDNGKKEDHEKTLSKKEIKRSLRRGIALEEIMQR